MQLLSALDGAYGDRPDAVTVGSETVSWAGLAAAADAIAATIAGAPAVAVHADASLHTIVAVVAGLRAGVPVVPVAADSGPDEVAYVLADSGATLLLRDGVAVPVAGAGGSAAPPPPDTALVVYTSGTTGRPKGVLLGAEALAADLDALADAWAWTADDTLVHGLPLFHVHGLVLGVLGALRHGCRLVHTVRPTPAGYAGAGGTLLFGVPTVWSRICAEPAAARALGGARLLVSGSAPLPGPVFEALAALSGHRPVERYGMTETLITCSTRADDGQRRPGVVGWALAGVGTRIAAVADGDGLGELEVRGPTMFSGYLHRPDATAASFTADGWFRTGDIAMVEHDGAHRIVGRASIDLIKTGGFKVGAGEVEDALLAHPAVAEAAVVGAPHDDLGEEIVAYVVASGVDGAALEEFVAARLSRHKRPRRIEFVKALPRNAMGKVQKSRLK